MDNKVIKDAIHQLESDILSIVSEFENDYGFVVTNILLHHTTYASSNNDTTVSTLSVTAQIQL
jgi:hypothetical protein